MPRTKITKAQEDDYRAYKPSPEQIRLECEEIRRHWKGNGARRKLSEPGGIREFTAGDLGLPEPFDEE